MQTHETAEDALVTLYNLSLITRWPPHEGEPDCECAMTEASMRTCPVHGEDGWRTSRRFVF